MSYFWQPQEIALTTDRVNYLKMSDVQKHIFTSNLKYQILLDSVQGRGPITAFLPIVSLPELETCMIWWDAFETIHSRTYTYMIKALYPNPSEIFDTVLEVPEILERAVSVTKAYDNLINALSDYKGKFGTKEQEYDLKKKLYLALIAVNILEGVRFYVSFACTFAFGELKLMEGSAKLISLIARDENLHLSITQHMINIIKDKENDPVFSQVIKDSYNEVIDMYKSAVDQEKEWAKYLFKDGSIIGLNEKLLGSYVEWIANRRLQSIGFNKIYDIQTTEAANPLPWTKNWLSSKGDQVAPQESEIIQYVVGGINKNTEANLDDFSL